MLAFVDITVFVNCPRTKETKELRTYFKVITMFYGYEILVSILTFNGLFIFCSRLLVIKLLTFFLNQEIVPIFIKYSIAINNM